MKDRIKEFMFTAEYFKWMWLKDATVHYEVGDNGIPEDAEIVSIKALKGKRFIIQCRHKSFPLVDMPPLHLTVITFVTKE